MSEFKVILLAGLLFLILGSVLYSPKAHADGTGVLVSNDGLIMTNSHVVFDKVYEKRVNYYVLYNNAIYQAEVVRYSVNTDLALIKISEKTTCLSVDAHYITKREIVYPTMFDVSDGVYNNYDNKRKIYIQEVLISSTLIQTDGPIKGYQEVFGIGNVVHPGNSGSPVLNIEGSVIGLVVATDGQKGYVVGNTAVVAFTKANSGVSCRSPNTISLKDNIVWIYEVKQ